MSNGRYIIQNGDGPLASLTEKSVANIVGIFIRKQVSDEELRFVERAEIMRLAIDGCKPFKLWAAETRPKFVGANGKWLTLWQAKHDCFGNCLLTLVTNKN